jgi:Putative lumazine-binding
MTDTPQVQAPDFEDIVRVVHIYTDSFGACDPKAFEGAFHPDAWIFFTDAAGTLFTSRLLDCFEDWARPPKVDVTGRIISVAQAGDVANVLLGFDVADNADGCWVDMHNLIRVDGVWKITNKTATHTSRAAGV